MKLWVKGKPRLHLRRRQRQPTLVLSLGKSQGRRSLIGYSPWGREELTRLSDFTFTFSLLQSLSHVQLFETPWTAAPQASLSITNSQSLLKLMSIKTVVPSNHLILCRPLLLLPSIFPSTRVLSNESVLCIRWPILRYRLCKRRENGYMYMYGWVPWLFTWNYHNIVGRLYPDTKQKVQKKNNSKSI